MKKQTTIYFSQCAGSVVELAPAGYSVRSVEVLAIGYPGQKQFVCNIDGRPRLRARVESDLYQRHLYISGVCESCGQVHAADRVILFNVPTGGASPCNDLCMFARGPNCECKCGGRNHGAGDLCTTQTIELFPDWAGVGA